MRDCGPQLFELQAIPMSRPFDQKQLSFAASAADQARDIRRHLLALGGVGDC
jgi:hypothetical protein